MRWTKLGGDKRGTGGTLKRTLKACKSGNDGKGSKVLGLKVKFSTRLGRGAKKFSLDRTAELL